MIIIRKEVTFDFARGLMLCIYKYKKKFSGNQSERFLSNLLNHGINLRQKQQISDANEKDRQIMHGLF